MGDLDFVLESLQVVPLGQLLRHEAVDERRVERLARYLQRHDVLRHPLLVTRLDAGADGRPASGGPGLGRCLILDGHHRAAALARLGARWAIAQVVDPADLPAVPDSWRHWAPDLTLGAALAALPGARVADYRAAGPPPESTHGVGLWASEPGAAGAAGDGLVATLTGPDGWARLYTPPGRAGLADLLAEMNRICDLYRSRPFWRLAPGDPRPGSGAGLLVAYRPLSLREIRLAAAAGLALPPGVTRFVVPGRILGLQVPVTFAQRARTAAAATRALHRYVRQRARSGLVRRFDGPVVVFD